MGQHCMRLARNQDRRALQLLRRSLLDSVARTEALYWQVFVARARLVCAEWLLKVGEDVRTLLERRRQQLVVHWDQHHDGQGEGVDSSAHLLN